jgi:endogenous inhibitor of DNA gyrase (YacG/DUF329 family)
VTPDERTGAPDAGETEGNPLRCPICGKPRLQQFRPFCSRRCADVDLGRWFTGAYAIAGEPADPEDDEA